MSRPSSFSLRQKISRHKVSMLRPSALCHNSGVRRCVTNKARRACDRGALSPTTEPGAHDGHEHVIGMRTRQSFMCDRGILSRKRILCRDRLRQSLRFPCHDLTF